MKVLVFSVYDKKASAFLAPFTFPARGQAVRAFSDTVNDPKTPFWKHPEDFDLHELGTFNEASGEFVNQREFIVGAGSVKETIDTGQLDWTRPVEEASDATEQEAKQ